jgi:predicted  nucleic acid-binding Zn-ribbon protein
MEMQAEINALQEALSEATQRAVAAEEELARLRSILQDREAGGALKMTETEILRSDKRCSLLACISHPLGLCVFLALIY